MSIIWSWAHDWIFQPALLPAWLSGLAAIVALVIGVWSVLHTGAAERRRDLRHARGIAVAIYPALLKLPTVIQNARDGLTTILARHGQAVGQSIAASLQSVAIIELPSMIERNIDRLFMLGDLAGPACLQLVTVMEQHNDTLDAISRRMMAMSAGQWAEGIGHLQESLRLLEQVVAKCEHEVRPLHDAVKG